MSLSVMYRRAGGAEVWAATEIQREVMTTVMIIAETRAFMRILVPSRIGGGVVIVLCGNDGGQIWNRTMLQARCLRSNNHAAIDRDHCSVDKTSLIGSEPDI